MSNTLLNQAETILKLQGGRMTNQRRLILSTLESMAGHPTAEEIFLSANRVDESLNLSTVYRTLNWLTEQDIITARVFNEERRLERFDANQISSSEDHYHFRCKECRQIFEFAAPEIEQFKASFSLHSGAEIHSANLIVYGVCGDCLAKKETGLDKDQ